MKVEINEVKDILLGETPIVKVYRGEDVIWERGGLPSGYTRVEYLEGTGTQYIDTGCKLSNNTKIDIDYSFSELSSLIGAQFSGRGLTINLNSTAYTRWGINSYLAISNLPIFKKETDTRYNIKFYNGYFYQDNILIVTIEDNVFQTSENAWLFLINGASSRGVKRIYTCKIYDNGTLVRDFIPCLDENNRPCMYDLVTKQPFYNQGTGEFLYA